MAGEVAVVRGRAVVLALDDVDTDRIIPARFLKSITFDGLGTQVFADDRAARARAGLQHPFDAPASAGAAVLLAGANFGCGSSREHAPRALAQWGIRAIVARSFGEIFFANAGAIGMPCVTVAGTDFDELTRVIDGTPLEEVTVNLNTQRVCAGAVSVASAMPEESRSALLTGHWDGLGLLLADYDAVTAAASRLPYLTGF